MEQQEQAQPLTSRVSEFWDALTRAKAPVQDAIHTQAIQWNRWSV